MRCFLLMFRHTFQKLGFFWIGMACVLSWLIVVPLVIGIASAALYLVSVLVGFLAGHALPAAAIFHYAPSARFFALVEPYFPHLLLGWLALGLTLSWLTLAPASPARVFYRPAKVIVARLLSRFGLMLCLSVATFYLGCVWSDVPRQGDLHGNSIAGLLPFSDAGGYWIDTVSEPFTGQWSPFSTRRPVSAATRDAVTFLSGGTYPGFLMLQAWLVAFSGWLVASSLARWRGSWAGVGFSCLLYIGIRPFLTTILTEPLGLVWSLGGLALLIEALRRPTVPAVALGVAGVTMGLLSRMGAMFTVPALVIWSGIVFRKDWRSSVRAMSVTVAALLVCLGMVQGLKSMYGSQQMVGANFSYTLCGLSIGTTWDGPTQRYSRELGELKTEEEQARFLYAKAFENIKANPSVFVHRLVEGVVFFTLRLPTYLFRGYMDFLFPGKLWAWIVLLMLSGWALLLKQSIGSRELLFHLLAVGGVFVSAPIVIFDDGWRVLMTGYPFIWLTASCGFTDPSLVRSGDRVPAPGREPKLAVALLTALALASLVLPGLAHYKKSFEPQLALGTEHPTAAIVRGGETMAGVLVVPDGAILPVDVPSVHLSSFREMVRMSGVEGYQRLVTPTPPTPPFAITLSPRVLGAMSSGQILIGPPEFLLKRDTAYWQVVLGPWPPDSTFENSNYWRAVLEANPVEGTENIPSGGK